MECPRRRAMDRSVSCRITDLDVTSSAGSPAPDRGGRDRRAFHEKAQIRLTMPATTWSPWSTRAELREGLGLGRVKLEANVFDLFRLRKFCISGSFCSGHFVEAGPRLCTCLRAAGTTVASPSPGRR